MAGQGYFEDVIKDRFDDEIFNELASYIEEHPQELEGDYQEIETPDEAELDSYSIKVIHPTMGDGDRIDLEILVEASIYVYETIRNYRHDDDTSEWYRLEGYVVFDDELKDFHIENIEKYCGKKNLSRNKLDNNLVPVIPKAEFDKVELDLNREVLHVDITGEIYLVCDKFSNQDIVKELGKMGVETRKSLTVSGFLKDAIIPKLFRKGETHLQRANRLAKPYLMRDIGGDALECVSDVAYADQRGVDGIIHISPFTCMPEIMSQNIFPAMRENCDIPILPLIMDEQTGKAGYLTRLEAFVDLMRRRKRKLAADKKSAETV